MALNSMVLVSIVMAALAQTFPCEMDVAVNLVQLRAGNHAKSQHSLLPSDYSCPSGYTQDKCPAAYDGSTDVVKGHGPKCDWTSAIGPYSHTDCGFACGPGDGPNLCVQAYMNCSGEYNSNSCCNCWRVDNTVSPRQPPTAFGDPHLVNILGEHFDLWQEGEVELLRIPRNSTARNSFNAPDTTARLRFIAEVSETAKRPDVACTKAPYMTAMRLSGSWLGARELVVKMVDGNMRVFLDSEILAPSSKSVAIGDDLVIERHSEPKVVVTVRNATINIMHGAILKHHFNLNMQARNLGSLGLDIGGLLGLDNHTRVAQKPAHCEFELPASIRERKGCRLAASLHE